MTNTAIRGKGMGAIIVAITATVIVATATTTRSRLFSIQRGVERLVALPPLLTLLCSYRLDLYEIIFQPTT
jgi:hypothetical protein